jgi:DNA-binding transcriptional LysR family regulator
VRLEWIADILAILDAGSLSRAAEARYLTQPAFSRRIKAIEELLGVELLDRSHKPLNLHKFVLAEETRLRELSASLIELATDLRQQDRKGGGKIVIACQHAIATSFAPTMIKRLSAGSDVDIRLRSADRDECVNLLFKKQADLSIIYHHPSQELSVERSFFEERTIGQEDFIPVFSAKAMRNLNKSIANDEIPIISYPGSVFFGKVMSRDLLADLQRRFRLCVKAETALTLAVLQLALVGVGVGWLPKALVEHDIASGRLTELDSSLFPRASLSLLAIRRQGKKTTAERLTWNMIGEV